MNPLPRNSRNNLRPLIQTNIWLLPSPPHPPRSIPTRPSHRNHRAILQSRCTFAPRKNQVSEPLLRGGVLVADCTPVGLDATDPAGDDFVEDGDYDGLCKVLTLGGLGVGVADGGVGFVGGEPFGCVYSVGKKCISCM